MTWNPPSETPDSRAEPECICPVEGPECPECPAHGLAAWRRQPLIPRTGIRDARGVVRVGYVEVEDPEEYRRAVDLSEEED